ncbi:DMT family transporter [Mycoplasma sp. ES3157-GEN-MYC]|uniref:DMT family transporter n=1 Tax=Mycoplasma miroungigenitalium TaxID=754515 RepID=UPI001C11A15D|nr:DMT family transporter [Mycoplasma miroungigenitalium]MBU4690500.1 DMT family transporter [Mycoplasma miroungigenitalium]
MNLIKKHNWMSNIIGLLSGLFWAIDGVFLLFFTKLTPTDSWELGILVTLIHDLFAILWAFIIVLIMKKNKEIKSAFTNKNIWILLLSSTIGAPFGMTMYILAIKEIGVGQTSSISICYVILASVLGFIFLKQKTSKNGLMGIVIAFICVLTFGILQIETKTHSFKGYIFAILCVVGWGMEAFLSSISMDRDIDPQVSIMIRHIVSAIVLGCIIAPATNSYSENVTQLLNYKNIWVIIAASFFGAISFICYYFSINKLGISLAVGLNISYSAFAVILEVIFFKGWQIYHWYNYLLSALILVSLLWTLVPDKIWIKTKK